MITHIQNTPALRDIQEQAITKTMDAFKEGFDQVVIQAPTGTGKTLISRYVAEPFVSALVGVPTTALQEQYSRELLQTGDVKILKGKAKYNCTVYGGKVAEAPCQFEDSGKQIKECASDGCCPYIEAKSEAEASPIAVLSLAGMLSWSQHCPEFFGRRAVHIVDEAHKLEDTARSHFEIVKTEHDLKRQLGKWGKYLPPMPQQGDQGRVMDYLRECAAVVSNSLMELCEIYDCTTTAELYAKAETSTLLFRSVAPLMAFKQNVDTLFVSMAEDRRSYVAYLEQREGKPSIVARPVNLQGLVRQHVFGEKTVFMSATIIGVESWAKSMGLDNYKFIDIPSTFPARNRRVFFTTIGNLNKDNVKELVPAGCEKIKKIKSHPELKAHKGLVHMPSYDLTELVRAHLGGDRDFVFAEKGKPGALTTHLDSSRPTTLVGPAFKEGIDLKDDLCRWLVVWKAAYKNPNDPLVAMKRETDPLWEPRQMIADFIQQIGRGVRSKDDWAVTYVFDGNLLKLLQRHRGLVPRYIWDSFQL